MSRLDELIAELCPDGVAFQRISECCELEKGTTPIQKAIPGRYPLVVTTSERKSADAYQFDKPTVCIPLVSSRGHGVASLNEVFYQDGEFALGNILCGVTPKDELKLSAIFLHVYLNYAKDFLLVPQMKGGANVSLSIDAIGRAKIPVPPMPVQREIVRILDNFTELTAELTAELSARRKQYKYYSDHIFLSQNTDCIKSLSDLVTIKTGKLDANAKTEDGEFPFFTCDANPYRIDKYAFDEEAILLSGNGSQIGHVNYYNGKFNAYQRTYVFTEFKMILPRYLLLYLKRYIRGYCMHYSKKGSVPYITLPMLQRFKVPVPSLDTQQSIVSILDCFEALCNDIFSGLPAEIAARQKQYEYYRDKLLMFKEKKLNNN